jgi:NAD(P)-dependent dehydrogenase (short-subunit alcohol dehydrogenase family)
MNLQNKVAVVTGAAHRIGKSIAVGLAETGAHVVVHYHQNADQAQATVDEIKRKGVRAVAVGGDLGTAPGVDALFHATEAEFGGVDILINSAAIMEAGEVLTLTREAWQRTLDLNLTGPFFCAQRAARAMLARGSGAIVNIADLAGLEPWAKYPAHSVSKAGIIMLTKVLAKALAPHIRVNAVAPGPVAKPQGWDNARWHTVGEHTLLKRTGSGYDVSQAVNFLLQQEFITGETLIVDGGSLYA